MAKINSFTQFPYLSCLHIDIAHRAPLAHNCLLTSEMSALGAPRVPCGGPTLAALVVILFFRVLISMFSDIGGDSHTNEESDDGVEAGAGGGVTTIGDTKAESGSDYENVSGDE